MTLSDDGKPKFVRHVGKQEISELLATGALKRKRGNK